MTKKQKFILFSVLVILFFLIAPLAIFYSQGYRFDFEKRRVFHTGGFDFKAYPRRAEVYLSGKFIKKTDFLSGAAFIENLLPEKYKVEIKKEEYFPWEKNLEVKEGLVTESKNIFLILKNPQFNLLSKNVEDFFSLPEFENLILKKNDNEGWVLYLLDFQSNTEIPLLREKEIGKKAEISDLKFSEDGKKILLKISGKKPAYFIFEIDKKNLISLDFLVNSTEIIEISNLSFNPDDSQQIFFIQKRKEKNSLFSAAYLEREISNPLLENILSYSIFDGSLFGLGKNGFLFQSDLTGRKISDFNREAFSLKKGVEYEILVFQRKIFLKEDGDLFSFDQDTQSFKKISEKTKGVKLSPDLRKLVYFTDYEIGIFFLRDIEKEQPQRKKGEKLFLIRFSEKIENLFWYTSHYLVFNVGKVIKIAEIDDRDRLNMYDIGEFSNPQIFWNKVNEKLYVLDEGNF